MTTQEAAAPEAGRSQSFTAPAAARPPVYTAVALAGVLLAVLSLHLWHADLSVPFWYAIGGDSFGTASAMRLLAAHGTIYDNPYMAAPLGAHFQDFPTLSFLHLAILWALGFVTGNGYLALNLYFIAIFPLTAITALYALRRLGLPVAAAIGPALLYTVLPLRFYREEAHLFYATYWLVPLVVLVIARIARGVAFVDRRPDGRPRPTRAGWLALVTFVALGCDNQDHVFFALVFLMLAALLGAVRSHSWVPLAAAVALGGVAFVSMVANVAPTVAFHASHGPNPAAFERYPEESQLYGLQIADVILPVKGHRVPGFAHLRAEFDARALLQNENAWVTMGSIGALGFVGLLAVTLLAPIRRIGTELGTLSSLNLFGTLVATVGGFGTLFNFYVRPEIRAYNRISVFLAFFALAAVGIGIATLWERFATNPQRRTYGWAAVGALTLLGVADQTTHDMVPPYAAGQAGFANDRAFVAAIEQQVPANAAVFELPWVRFPESAPVNGMDPFQEFRPTLHARTTRWSYGAIEGRAPSAWERDTSRLPAKDLVRELILGGFDGIFIFRSGYADRAAGLERELTALLGAAPLVAGDQGESFFSLAQLRKNALAADPRLGDPGLPVRVAGAPQATFGDGFYGEEHAGSHVWRWATGNPSIRFTNDGPERLMRIAGTFEIASRRDAASVVLGSHTVATLTGAPGGLPFAFDFRVPHGASTLQIHTGAPAFAAPGDPRELVLRFVDTRFSAADIPAFPKLDVALDDLASQSAPADALPLGQIRWTRGCSAREAAGTATWHWCDADGEIVVTGTRPGRFHVRAVASTPGQPHSTVIVTDVTGTRRLNVGPAGAGFDAVVDLRDGRRGHVAFHADAAPLAAPNDPRHLVLRLDGTTMSTR